MIEESKLLLSKTDDLIASVKRGRRFAFTYFLNPEEQKTVCDRIASCSLSFSVNGGYDGSERNMVCVYDSSVPTDLSFPVSALVFSYSGYDKITHRDVLGALTSLGIKREFIGDIIFFDKKCVFFTDFKITQFVIQNLLSVKNNNVSVSECFEDITYTRSYEQKDIIVSSMRLDCLIGELCSVSRTAASELICAGLVFVNGTETRKKDKTVIEGDIISVRKKGKYRVDLNCGTTKKGRIKLKVLKYI